MKRRTKIPRRLPRNTPPTSAEREYYRNLRRYSDAYCRMMREALGQVVPSLAEIASIEQPVTRVRSDAYSVSRMDANIEDRLRQLFDYVEAQLAHMFPDDTLRFWARSMAGLVNHHAKKNVVRVAKAVDLDVEPLLHDKGLNPYFQNVIDENVGLIKSIPKAKMETFKNALVASITADDPTRRIMDIIQSHIGKDGNVPARARLIARDQVGKLNGRMNQYRQQQLGGKRYRWKGAMDERERHDHKHLQDTVQRWDKPPIVDKRTGRREHPGGDYQCRCRAEMVMEDILD